jgi:hypothetical protein
MPSRSGPTLRHLLDQEALLLELGDVLWYLALIGSLFGWSLEQLVVATIAKLRKRYPEGFETARCNPGEEGHETSKNATFLPWREDVPLAPPTGGKWCPFSAFC